MTDVPDGDVAGAADATTRRDAVVERVRDHANQIARELALLKGGDYGREAFRTDAGEWTVKYEAGQLEFLLFEGQSGVETYVVSTQRPPDPDALARAMTDYEAFVDAYNDYVASLDGTLDDVPDEFPEVASTETVVAERDRILARVRDVADRMAGELHRYDGTDYGTFSTTVDGTRWELKWEGDRASYLRVGGEGGIYLLSQYGPPPIADLRDLTGDVAGFVEAFNDHVTDITAEAEELEL